MTREVIARAPPPAFLFPNQQCQRPEPLSRGAHRLAPDVGGGGYLSNLEFRVKPFFNKTVRTKPPNQPEGQSNNPKRPSKEQRQTSQEESFKETFKTRWNGLPNSCEPFNQTPGTALLVKRYPRVNRPFPSSSMLWPRPLRKTKTG